MNLILTREGTTIVTQDSDGLFIMTPIKDVTFDTIGNNVNIRLGSDGYNRQYNSVPYGNFTISGVVPASISALRTAMGVLLQISSGGGGGTGTVTTANNGLSSPDSGVTVVLGQDLGAAGDPAALITDREIPMNGKSLVFNFGTGNAKLRASFNNNGTCIGYEVVNSNTGANANAQISFSGNLGSMTMGVRSSNAALPNERYINTGNARYIRIGDLDQLSANGNILAIDTNNNTLGFSSVNGSYYMGLAPSAGGSAFFTQFNTTFYWNFAGNNEMNLTNQGRLTIEAAIVTGSPSTSTRKEWKLGSVHVGSGWILDNVNTLRVEVDGVVYNLALATPG